MCVWSQSVFLIHSCFQMCFLTFFDRSCNFLVAFTIYCKILFVNHTQFGLWATKCDVNKMKWNLETYIKNVFLLNKISPKWRLQILKCFQVYFQYNNTCIQSNNLPSITVETHLLFLLHPKRSTWVIQIRKTFTWRTDESFLSLTGFPPFRQLCDCFQIGLQIVRGVALEFEDDAGQVRADRLLQDGLKDLTLDIVLELLTTVTSLFKPVVQICIVCTKNKDKVKPALGEKFTAVIVHNAASLLQCIVQLINHLCIIVFKSPMSIPCRVRFI